MLRRVGRKSRSFSGEHAGDTEPGPEPAVPLRDVPRLVASVLLVAGATGLAAETSTTLASTPPQAKTAAARVCAGHRATIVGTRGDDRITGTARADVILAGAGNDVVDARGGNDVVCGGGGNDRLMGLSGADRLYGGTGHDILSGGGGPDRLYGQDGNDVLVGGTSNDVLVGGSGVDRFKGGRGTNTFGTDRADNGFFESFEASRSLGRFRYFVHSALQHQDEDTQWHGDHNRSCEGPTTTRTVHFHADEGVFLSRKRGELVWWCAPLGHGSGHMMTSFNTEGYAQADFSPDRKFRDVKQVCWDQNMTDLGERKWTQMVIVSESTFQAHARRLDYVIPGLGDVVAGGVLFPSSNFFGLQILRGSTTTFYGGSDDANFTGFTTADKARRFRTCVVDLNNGNVRISLERASSTEIRVQNGRFPDGAVRVIFQDDNYNPTKSGAAVPNPFTWHWDNVLVR